MAVITLPLGLLQEFTIYHKRGEARDTCKNAHGHDCGLNTIQLEQRNLTDPVHTYNFGYQTEFYKWCLVTQLICLLVIGVLVGIQKITNKAI
ncbi:unnamed protein product [Oikopleura dioica]|uniref:Uncharacterized protein n=1 Tax=Oikopleura dioica TaxID=34765 RepID=E4WU90_OIKDI|nr:unnamed protein product [Oikopleura dioica]